MIETSALFLFFSASVLLALAPGPDNLFVLTESLVHGKKAGMQITLGLCTGLIFHTAGAAFGLTLIFKKSIWAFNILKYAGVGYLLFLAWKSFRAGVQGKMKTSQIALTGFQLYRRGILMNISNPKVALFFIAFLPQFADPQKNSVFQFFLLGFLFILAALLVFGSISLLSGWAGEWLSRFPKGEKYLNRMAGGVFTALALKLFLTGQK